MPAFGSSGNPAVLQTPRAFHSARASCVGRPLGPLLMLDWTEWTVTPLSGYGSSCSCQLFAELICSFDDATLTLKANAFICCPFGNSEFETTGRSTSAPRWLHWSPAFLASQTSFMEDSFSKDWTRVGGMVSG